VQADFKSYFRDMILTDTHSHLYSDQFDADFKEVLERCEEQHIQRIFLPNIDLQSIPRMHQLQEDHPQLFFPMMGLHPCSVEENYMEVLNTMETMLREGKYCAVGEIGIDLYWDKTTLSIQQGAFRRQVGWAKELGLPIVIHARDSFDELFELLDELNDDRLTGIFHCFTGTVEQAQRVLAYGGFMLGIGGVVTFKNSGLDKVVAQLPLECLVLETDSPYLAPHPYRGKRNETSYLQLVAQKIADIHETSIEKVADITTANSKKVFNC
jgi:TatD DNase family protein